MRDFVSRSAYKALHTSEYVVMPKPLPIVERAYLWSLIFTLFQLGCYHLANFFQERNALPYLCELGSFNGLVSLIHDSLDGAGSPRFYLVPNPQEISDFFRP